MHERRLRTSEWSSAGPQTPINTDHTHDLNKYQLGKNANYQEIRSSAVNFNKFLGKRNLKLDFDAGASEYRLRCYGPRAARMKGYDFYHVAIAHVPERDFLQ